MSCCGNRAVARSTSPMGYAAHLWLSRRRHQPNLAVRDTTPMAKHSEIASVQFSRVIPEIDIWRGAKLMLKR